MHVLFGHRSTMVEEGWLLLILSPSVTIRRDSPCGTLAPAEFGDSVKMMGTGKSAANAQNRTEVENPLITTSAQVYRVGGFPGEDLTARVRSLHSTRITLQHRTP